MEKKSNKKIIFLIVLLGGLLVALAVVLIMFVFNKENNEVKEESNVIKENINESINEVKTLKGLTFESTKIIFNNGTSTLTTKVTNNDSIDYVKETFKIIIKDKSNNIIVELPGSISGGVKSNEIRYITSSVDLDLSSDAYYIEYEEVE